VVKPGANLDLAAGSDPPAAERFVHHHPDDHDDHETEAIHHDDIIDHDHDDRPVNDRDEAFWFASAPQSRLSAALPAHLLAAGSQTAGRSAAGRARP
jgi:ABC-type Zn2+ transport system substrate-binding protein/surface adhesin